MPAAEAARVLAGRFGVSARQARRYADQARRRGGRRCRRRAWCSPSSCPRRWPGGSGRMPARAGPRSPPWWHGRWRSSWPGAAETIPAGERPGGRGGVRLRPSRGHGIVSGLRHIGAAAARPASCGPARKDGRPVTSAAIYARVSSARQKKDQTIGSQTAALREHAAQARLDVPEEWVFEDEGHSGATLVRPALEALRDLVAQGCVDVVLVLLPGPAGPQVRLPGAAAGGVRPGRGPGRVRQGPARRQPRGPAAGPVPGHVRRVREGPAGRAVPARQGLPRPLRVGQRAVRRPVRLPVRPQDRPDAAPPTRSSSTRRRWWRRCSAATPTTAPPSPTWPAGSPARASPPGPASPLGPLAWSGRMLRNPAYAGTAVFGKTMASRIARAEPRRPPAGPRRCRARSRPWTGPARNGWRSPSRPS